MYFELGVGSKGRVTLEQSVLDHLGVAPGDTIGVALLPGGRVELIAAAAGRDLERLRGLLRRPGEQPVSVETMRDVIETGRQRPGEVLCRSTRS